MLLVTADIVIKWIPGLMPYKNTREFPMGIVLVSLILTLIIICLVKLSVAKHPKIKKIF